MEQANFSRNPIARVHLPFLVRLDTYDYRAISLFAACMVYAVWGAPTPDTIGLPEYSVGLLLLLSIGIGRMRDALLAPAKTRFWKSAAQLFFFYGLTVPVIVGAVSGGSIVSMARDFIPFAFLFLPLFLLPVLRARPYYYRSTLVAVVLIGFIFSLRSLAMRNPAFCAMVCTDELLYLENMPTVLFCALFLIGTAMRGILLNRTGIQNYLIFILLMFLAMAPVAAMATTHQRASLGAVALYSLILLIIGGVRHPRGAVILACMLSGFVLLLQISFEGLFDDLSAKTRAVGLNMRPQEFAAVWQVVTENPVTFLFGAGWGSHFNSPAVGGLSVNFTHNFFTSVLLKTGFCGLILSTAYIAGLLERLTRVIIKNYVLGLALCAPILIDLTLYASFKSLDFGLVLLMISGSLIYSRQSESPQKL